MIDNVVNLSAGTEAQAAFDECGGEKQYDGEVWSENRFIHHVSRRDNSRQARRA